ncbi:hypothetical protein RHGRI_026193 [Rhododendron griersonianum]|uniref:Uncharacterized protein n=1 Tax=Rhododendron griersonianum TaxID=479676 RepID=A0AAV6IU64_9ERIC|nr:hypothetical protein RHGRI_026193 [Rhododendron griersonianum]
MKRGLKVTWDDDSGDDDSESGFQIGGEWNSRASVLVATVDSPISPKLLSISSSSSLESIESDKSSAEVKIARSVDNEGEEFEIESIHKVYDLMYQDYMKQGKKEEELETSLKVVEKEKMCLREDLINISKELDELKKYNAKFADKFAIVEKERLEALREIEIAKSWICELERDLNEASIPSPVVIKIQRVKGLKRVLAARVPFLAGILSAFIEQDFLEGEMEPGPEYPFSTLGVFRFPSDTCPAPLVCFGRWWSGYGSANGGGGVVVEVVEVEVVVAWWWRRGEGGGGGGGMVVIEWWHGSGGSRGGGGGGVIVVVVKVVVEWWRWRWLCGGDGMVVEVEVVVAWWWWW